LKNQNTDGELRPKVQIGRQSQSPYESALYLHCALAWLLVGAFGWLSAQRVEAIFPGVRN
jgi:hypothetical protein